MDGLQLKYFVLNPSSSDDAYADASREAMLTFAKYIKGTNPKLSEDLSQWVEKCDLEDNREGK